MPTKIQEQYPDKLTATWADLQSSTGFVPIIRTQTDRVAMMKLADYLVDVIEEDTKHPLSGLLVLVSDILQTSSIKDKRSKSAPPREVLRFLMDANNLKQTDLSDIVSQGTLSSILNGRRDISKGLAKKFASRFRVSVDTFI